MLRSWRILFLGSLFLLLAVRGGLFYIEWRYADEVDALTDFPVSSQVFDRHGKLLYEFFGDIRRIPIPEKDIPKPLMAATLMAEDENFYKHGGFDPLAIIRAFWRNLQANSIQEGGSTIGQQLVKNTILGRSHGYFDKLNEIFYSIAVDARFSKDDILTFYLNTIPYGANVYGVEAASRYYFQKSARDLTVAEAATLAALPKHPSYLSPFGDHKEDLINRRDYILEKMYKHGDITELQYSTAITDGVTFASPAMPIEAPHFVMYVREQLEQVFGREYLETKGLNIVTTLDLDWQKQAEDVVKQNEARMAYDKANSVGLLAMEPTSGEIIAMVGNKDYFSQDDASTFNMTTALRQPGSAFKPIVYASLLEQGGVTPATILYDVPTNFGTARDPYTPHDYDNKYRGPVTVRQALAQSLNIPAVKALTMVGLDRALDMAEDLGISTVQDRSRFGPSLVLGGAEVKLVELVNAYATFANSGVFVPAQSILNITTYNGRVLTWHHGAAQEVLNAETAYQISSILSDNNARAPIFGVRSPLAFTDHQVAAKTGTTQSYRDAWTVGYTPSIALGVWVGNSDNKPLRAGSSGAMAAAPIWRGFMDAYLKDQPRQVFNRPDGLQRVRLVTAIGEREEDVAPWQIEGMPKKFYRVLGVKLATP